MKKNTLICIILTVLCIAATVTLRISLENSKPEYKEVMATVVKSETKRKKVMGNYQSYYEVVVNYNGKKYELQNTHNTYSYPKGREVTAFLSEGELYANIEGVRSSTPLGTAYFISLFICFGMLTVTLILYGKEKEKRTVGRN